ncbi:MAG: hydrogenase maturation protease [Anaerolineaceae bacterium]|nr:hydrogenase maturation protease [Anaerolineaceae bacterium]
MKSSENMLQQLIQAQNNIAPARVALVGVGHPLLGDDSAGLLTLRKVIRNHPKPPDNILLIEAGVAPENFTGPIRRFNPDVVMIIDAMDAQESPGELLFTRWSPGMALDPQSYTIPLSTFAAYLHQALGCKIYLIGIQINRVHYGTAISPEVSNAIDTLCGEITGIWNTTS